MSIQNIKTLAALAKVTAAPNTNPIVVALGKRDMDYKSAIAFLATQTAFLAQQGNKRHFKLLPGVVVNLKSVANALNKSMKVGGPTVTADSKSISVDWDIRYPVPGKILFDQTESSNDDKNAENLKKLTL